MGAQVKITAAEMADAPRVWRKNGIGVRVRVVDPEWLHQHQQVVVPAVATPVEPTIAPQLLDAYRAAGGRTNQILSRVARERNVTVALIKGETRARHVVTARHQAAYEMSKLGLSLPKIGRLLGGRDHTTILHAIRSWPARAAKLGIPVDLEAA